MNAAAKPAPDRTVRISRIWLKSEAVVDGLDAGITEKKHFSERQDYRISYDPEAGLVSIYSHALKQRRGKAAMTTVPLSNVAGWVAWEDEAR